MKLRLAILAAAAAVTGATVAIGLGESAGGRDDPARPAADRAVDQALPARRADTRFAYLAEQRSNRCDLQAGAIMRYAAERRLQGSCCFPMDRHAYGEQLRELRRYADESAIPRDPYDVPVKLAKRLLRYDRAISLSSDERSTYRRAMRTSTQGGPCCCPCWRWTAFRGLSKFLIARREWPASRLASLIDALEGCGGPSDHHAT